MIRNTCEFCNHQLVTDLFSFSFSSCCTNHLPIKVYYSSLGKLYIFSENENIQLTRINDGGFWRIRVFKPQYQYLKFDYDLKITPENFETKIKKILLFL